MSSYIRIIQRIPQTGEKVTGSVIFFHGSGDTGAGIKAWIQELVDDFSLPHVNFIFPTAPVRPYTPLNGQPSYVWFDRYDINPEVPEHVETLDAIGKEVKSLIEKKVPKDVPLNRVIVGGFSMGGCLALHTAYRLLPDVAGVFALSSFLNNGSQVYKTLQTQPPKKLAPLFMCHGEKDELVPINWGQKTFDLLKEYGVKGEFIPIKTAFHELDKNELRSLLNWIKKVLPET